MRVRELYEQVAGLGFEKALEDADIFYQAANRALLQVNSIRPATSSFIINHRPMKNMLPESFDPVEKIADVSFEATGAKAYYFECLGNGVCYIKRKNEMGTWSTIGEVSFSSESEFTSFSGFIKDGDSFVDGDVKLEFTGNYVYTIRNVALYEYLYSSRAEDIPEFKPYTRYDMAALVSDFLGLESPPITEDTDRRRLYRDYDMEGRRFLIIPRDNPGVFNVSYRRRPKELENVGTPSEDESLIDLDEELCALLPLNIAAYVWADDEPEKAEYYLGLYRERRAEIESKDRSYHPVKYVTNGW
jgi:hypothetical protein